MTSNDSPLGDLATEPALVTSLVDQHAGALPPAVVIHLGSLPDDNDLHEHVFNVLLVFGWERVNAMMFQDWHPPRGELSDALNASVLAVRGYDWVSALSSQLDTYLTKISAF